MKPRVLVVEDDPVSRAFFREVLAGLPAGVDVAAGCGEAIARTRIHAYALWLVDAHLPDGGAAELLPRLRASGDSTAVAIAQTASRDPGVHAALAAAGFVDVLVKPVAAAALLASVRRWLGTGVREARATFAPAAPPARAGLPCPGPWDDGAALAALGDRAGVQALRALFVRELPEVVAQVHAASCGGATGPLGEHLHRLVSACAYTGATALGDAVRRLQSEPGCEDALAAFHEAAMRLGSPGDGLGR